MEMMAVLEAAESADDVEEAQTIARSVCVFRFVVNNEEGAGARFGCGYGSRAEAYVMKGLPNRREDADFASGEGAFYRPEIGHVLI